MDPTQEPQTPAVETLREKHCVVGAHTPPHITHTHHTHRQKPRHTNTDTQAHRRIKVAVPGTRGQGLANAPQPHLPLKGILRKSQGGHIYTQFCLFLFSQISLIPPTGKNVLLFFTDFKSMQAQGVSKMSCNSKPASSFLFFFLAPPWIFFFFHYLFVYLFM